MNVASELSVSPLLAFCAASDISNRSPVIHSVGRHIQMFWQCINPFEMALGRGAELPTQLLQDLARTVPPLISIKNEAIDQCTHDTTGLSTEPFIRHLLTPGYIGAPGNVALGEVVACEVYAQQHGNSRLDKKQPQRTRAGKMSRAFITRAQNLLDRT